jgi:hypothetical protein
VLASRPRLGSNGGVARPNAPRMITVLLAIALTVVGVSLTVQPIGFVHDLLKSAGIRPTREQAHWMLLASPLLLVAGSLLPNL